MCMYVCMYVCMHACMYVNVCTITHYPCHIYRFIYGYRGIEKYMYISYTLSAIINVMDPYP